MQSEKRGAHTQNTCEHHGGEHRRQRKQPETQRGPGGHGQELLEGTVPQRREGREAGREQTQWVAY